MTEIARIIQAAAALRKMIQREYFADTGPNAGKWYIRLEGYVTAEEKTALQEVLAWRGEGE